MTRKSPKDGGISLLGERCFFVSDAWPEFRLKTRKVFNSNIRQKVINVTSGIGGGDLQV